MNTILRQFVMLGIFIVTGSQALSMNTAVRTFTLINSTQSAINVTLGLDNKVFPLILEAEPVHLPFTHFNSFSIGRTDYTQEIASHIQEDGSTISLSIKSPEPGLLGLGYLYNPYKIAIDKKIPSNKDESISAPTYSDLIAKFNEDFKQALKELKANPKAPITAAFSVGLAPQATPEQINDFISLKKSYWQNVYQKAHANNVSLLPAEADRRTKEVLRTKFGLSDDEIARHKAANDLAWSITHSSEKSKLEHALVGNREKKLRYLLAHKGITLYDMIQQLNEADQKIAHYKSQSYAALGSTVSANLFPQEGQPFRPLPANLHRAAGELLLENALANRAKLAEKIRTMLLAQKPE